MFSYQRAAQQINEREGAGSDFVIKPAWLLLADLATVSPHVISTDNTMMKKLMFTMMFRQKLYNPEYQLIPIQDKFDVFR